MSVCVYCGRRARDERGWFDQSATCTDHDDLPGLEPLETESAWIRLVRGRDVVVSGGNVASSEAA